MDEWKVPACSLPVHGPSTARRCVCCVVFLTGDSNYGALRTANVLEPVLTSALTEAAKKELRSREAVGRSAQ